MVFDGAERADLAGLSRVGFEVRFAGRSGPDAADDVIVALVEDRHAYEAVLAVVTSDAGLVARLPPGVVVVGAGRFLRRLDGDL